ncbi:nucleotidyltransferase [Serratia fonticola]|nr:nucleotidyltransferase [Serratia fonticola]
MKKAYKKQVQLLLDVLPEVAKERCFAMHGGTAINLFFCVICRGCPSILILRMLI